MDGFAQGAVGVAVAANQGPLPPEAVVELAFLVARRLLDPERARDVAQETWIKYRAQAARECEGWSGSRARAWVRTVASNAARSLLRKAAPQLGLEDGSVAVDADPAARAELAEEEAHDRAAAVALLAELPRPQRELLALRELEGWSWEAIGRLLGEKTSTLRARYARLRADLRAAAARRAGEGRT